MYHFFINRNYRYKTCNHCDNKVEYTRSILRHGEYHWRYNENGSTGGRISWSFFKSFCHLSLALDAQEREIVFCIALPWLLSLWISHTMPLWLYHRLPKHHFRHPKYQHVMDPGCPNEQSSMVTEIVGYEEGSYPESRDVFFLSVHHATLWWHFWFNDDEWKSTDPFYRRGSFNLPDFFLGPRVYDRQAGQSLTAWVELPEGNYPVVATPQTETWYRPRWPTTWWPCHVTHFSWEIVSECGLPFPGKGENSWDCGDDALFSISRAGRTLDEALEGTRAAVLDYRRRYGGFDCMKNPWPQSPEDRQREWQANKAFRESQGGQIAEHRSTE